MDPFYFIKIINIWHILQRGMQINEHLWILDVFLC